MTSQVSIVLLALYLLSGCLASVDHSDDDLNRRLTVRSNGFEKPFERNERNDLSTGRSKVRPNIRLKSGRGKSHPDGRQLLCDDYRFICLDGMHEPIGSICVKFYAEFKNWKIQCVAEWSNSAIKELCQIRYLKTEHVELTKDVCSFKIFG